MHTICTACLLHLVDLWIQTERHVLRKRLNIGCNVLHHANRLQVNRAARRQCQTLLDSWSTASHDLHFTHPNQMVPITIPPMKSRDTVEKCRWPACKMCVSRRSIATPHASATPGLPAIPDQIRIGHARNPVQEQATSNGKADDFNDWGLSERSSGSIQMRVSSQMCKLRCRL